MRPEAVADQLPATTPSGMPSAEVAERTVLGAILVDGNGIHAARELLAAEDFHREGHRRIFRVLVDLSASGSALDLVTVHHELQRRGEVAAVGGAGYLAGLVDGVPRATRVAEYAHLVREASRLRALVREGHRLAADAGGGEAASAAELARDAAARLLGLTTDGRVGGLRLVEEQKHAVIERLRAASEQNGVRGVATGFADIDRLTTGLQPGELVILAARPSVGKTALALDIARHVAGAGLTVAMFSAEMSAGAIVDRLLCSMASVDTQIYRAGLLRERDWALLAPAFERLLSLPLWVDDSGSPTTADLRMRCLRLTAESGPPALVIVDYLQLVRGSEKRYGSREQEVAAVSRDLKAIAKELACPVLALAQLSRAAEQRAGRPQLSDLRETGAIEQDADAVLFLWRPDDTKRSDIEMVIGKQRNGPVGVLNLAFLESYTRFENAAKEEMNS